MRTAANAGRPPDPINATISFAYTMLKNDCVSALRLARLEPTIGALHVSRPGRPALALDLMEPFRALIADSVAVSAFNRGELTEGHFLRTAAGSALTDSGRKAFFSAYGRRMDTEITHPVFGYPHADGHLLGVAIVVPRDVSPEEQKGLGRVLFDESGQPRNLDLLMGRTGAWTIELCEDDEPREALQSRIWTDEQNMAKENGPTTWWATVTPIVLDRHPKSPGEGEEIIAASCERIGLPRPSKVVISLSSMFVGVLHARRFPNITHKQGFSRHHVHAILTFDRPIVGPVLLGAGRYRGYGLCRPWRNGGEP